MREPAGHLTYKQRTTVKVRCSLGCSDHEWWNPGSCEEEPRQKAESQPQTSGEQTLACSGESQCDMTLDRREAQESWFIFKDHLCQDQDWSTLMCRKLGKGDRARLSLSRSQGTSNWDIPKLLGPDGMPTNMLRELAYDTARSLSVISERLQ